MNAPVRVRQTPAPLPEPRRYVGAEPTPARVEPSRSRPGVAARASRRAFWILSDLRLDEDPGYALPDPPDCDAVLVAGNVGAGLCESLDRLAAALGGRQAGRPVFVVPGNVEYRSATPLVEALARGRELADRLGFHLLSDAAARFGPPDGDGTVVIGATFWTDWRLGASPERPSARVMARTAGEDGKTIRLRRGRALTPLDSLAMHARSRAYIEDALTSAMIQSLGLAAGTNACLDCVRKGDVAVVLTCHSPSPRSLPDDWEGWHEDGWVAASRASEAEAAMEAWGAPRLWVHGNVPRAVDCRIGRTRVVANPRVGERGYAGFDPALVIEA
ncbi:metallophosphoesterase [Methylobacterium mesophilicum]|uniref:metallophosphoesterase n=1 Tax=Methylobacterium mesophilicum TaxID=39956 RepID=UPI002F32EDD7